MKALHNGLTLLVTALIAAAPINAALGADYRCTFDKRATLSALFESIDAQVTFTSTITVPTITNEFTVWDGQARSFANATYGDDFTSFTEVYTSGGLVITTMEKDGGSAVRHYQGWMFQKDWPLVESPVTFFGRCEVSQ